jgi:hypothetical protein
VVGSPLPRTVEQSANRWLVGLAAVVLGAAVVGVVMRPREGSVVVTVSGPQGGAVRGASIRVDGVERCTASPCEVKELMPGAHFISASATGLSASANRAFVIASGERAAQHVALSQVERTSAGLNVSAIGNGLHVFVDGRDAGVPPIALDHIEPGPHTVRVVGDERYYQPYEESVDLRLGEVRSLGPVRLRVIRGRLQLIAGDGTDGARVAVDGRRVLRLPAVLELSADQSHEVTATRQGFEDFSSDVVFDGVAERSVAVQLQRPGEAVAAPIAMDALAPVAANAPPPTTTVESPARVAANAPPRTITVESLALVAANAPSRTTTPAHAHVAPPPAPRVSQPVTTGPGTLDLNSIPRAAVVVNGRPVGTTPLRVRVEPGRQTIIFIHPQLGRKIASASVPPGGRTAVGVKF